jgi:putative membrane protein
MRIVAFAAAALALLTGSAYAHADGLPVGPDDLWHHWSLQWWICAPLLVGHWLYGKGVLRAWARAGVGRIITRSNVIAFAAGEIALVLALISPLDSLGETLLAAHMSQHILLTTLAPMLLVLGAPALAWTWGLPSASRTLGRSRFVRALVLLWRWLTKPMMALLLHSAALWLWHTPVLFDAALRHESVHTLEHMSFFATALMFWSAMLRRQTAPALAAFLVLIVFIQCGMLGAVLALAPDQLYAYGDRPVLWGLSGVEDQQIAGLLMWAPAGLAYMAPFAWLASKVMRDPYSRGERRDSDGIMRARTSSRSMK